MISSVIRFISYLLSFFLIVAGIWISVIFFLEIDKHYTYGGRGSIAMDDTGQIGDFIGGVVGTVFSFAGFIILVLTLQSQSKSAYVEQFESKFFELLRIHRDNVKDFHISRNVKANEKIYTQEYFDRRAFRIIMDDFFTCRNDLDPLFSGKSESDIYEDSFRETLIANFKEGKRTIDLKKLARINISYCVLFFGVATEGTLILKSLFNNKYKSRFVDDIIKYLQMKPIKSSDEWEKWKNLKEVQKFGERVKLIDRILDTRKQIAKGKEVNLRRFNLDRYYYSNTYVKYYGGHQHRLGHYFRHLFQAFKYINEQKKLGKGEKYFYAKTLRAQLSTYEQEVLFINSLSFLGASWELFPEYQKTWFEFLNKRLKKRAQLITQYNIIKNVPGEHLYGLYYKWFYPDVRYEFESKI